MTHVVQLASVIKSAPSLFLLDCINDSELVRQEVLPGKLEKKVNSRVRKRLRVSVSVMGLNKNLRVVSNM